MKAAFWVKLGFAATIAVAFAAIASFVFFVWAHHMFIIGVSSYSRLTVSLLTLLLVFIISTWVAKRASTQKRHS